jgi:hypothetical protein
MFAAILTSISNNTQGISTGGTGYLDGIEVRVPSKGLDKARRPFFSLPLEVSRKMVIIPGGTEHGPDVNRGTVTFFQRYTDNKNLWTTGGMESHLVGSAVKPGYHEDFIEEVLLRVLSGETLTIEVPKEFHGMEKLELTIRLLKPEECDWEPTTTGPSPDPMHSQKAQLITYRQFLNEQAGR